MTLRPDETEINGQWTFDGAQIQADANCKRIEELTTSTLQRVAGSRQYGDWETLFRDRNDGRFWERTYPQGDMQGGGPPRLRVISREEAERKYGPLP